MSILASVIAVLRRRPLMWAMLGLLLWTTVLRLPFAHIVDDDEAFFSLVATRWQHGELPYAVSFDVKPPLLFLIYLLANLVTGGGLVAIKGLEIVMTAWGAWALYRLVSRHGTSAAALWAAGLYPVYSLVLSGVDAPNLMIEAPFVIMACDYALRARQDGLKAVAISGALIGCAGLVKQTAVFEALALMGFLVVSLPAGRRGRALAVFAAVAAAAWLPFIVYFGLNGALRPAFDDVVLSAVLRVGGDVQPGPGGTLRPVTLVDGLGRFVPILKPLFALLWLAMVAVLRYRRLSPVLPRPLLHLCGFWLAAAALSLFSQHAGLASYAQDFIAPLLVVSGVMVTQGFAFRPGTRPAWLAAYALVAVLVPAYIERGALWFDPIKGRNDPVAVGAVADALKADGVKAGDRIFVPNRGLMIYVATRTLPAANVFHPLQLMCAFPSVHTKPLAEALAARADYLVVARTDIRMTCETADRHVDIDRAIARDYRPVKVVQGEWDAFTIYRRKS